MAELRILAQRHHRLMPLREDTKVGDSAGNHLYVAVDAPPSENQ